MRIRAMNCPVIFWNSVFAVATAFLVGPIQSRSVQKTKLSHSNPKISITNDYAALVFSDAELAASMIRSAISRGQDTAEAWLASSDIVFAPMRFAMKR